MQRPVTRCALLAGTPVGSLPLCDAVAGSHREDRSKTATEHIPMTLNSLINLFSTPQEREQRAREQYRRWQQPKRLRDGTWGYPTRAPRTDDCMAAAIATVLQAPISEVPDPQIDFRLEAGETVEEIERSAWAELAQWLGDRGLRLVIHENVPVPIDRWIGIVPRPGPFQGHTLAMSHGKVLFDPVVDAWGVGKAPTQIRRLNADDVSWGLSFPLANQQSDNGVTHG